MRAVRGLYDTLPDDAKNAIDAALVRIFEEHEDILSVEINMVYFLQAMSRRHSHRKVEILVDVDEKRPSPIIRRIIVAAMANWQCDYWLSYLKRRYASLHEWDKRAMILGSYFLTDEGKHWRVHTKDSWNEMELLIRDWFCQRFQTQKNFPT